MPKWSVNEDLKVMAAADRRHAARMQETGNPRQAARLEQSAKEVDTERLKRQANGQD
jgi:hypothetical protein